MRLFLTGLFVCLIFAGGTGGIVSVWWLLLSGSPAAAAVALICAVGTLAGLVGVRVLR